VAEGFVDAEDTPLLALLWTGVPIATKQLETPEDDPRTLEDGLLTLAFGLRSDEEDGLANDLGFLSLRPRSIMAPFNESIGKDGSGNGNDGNGRHLGKKVGRKETWKEGRKTAYHSGPTSPLLGNGRINFFHEFRSSPPRSAKKISNMPQNPLFPQNA